MKKVFYPRLAWDSIRKNRRMVFPYMLTCICMISMFYILEFLASTDTTALFARGGTQMSIIMNLGGFVIAVFSLIFLFYTYSFLIRRRAAEFGLYNVLGMGKGNLARILTCETLMTSGASLVLGLFLGIALSKLAELGLVNLLHGTVGFTLRVDRGAVLMTVICYLVIFGIIWIASVIRVGRSTAVSLLKSEKAGEKAPKANWFLGLLGIAILAAAYYIALTIENPVAALQWFFLAVIMVIVATYLLMVAGSVLLCKILQKNKKYYYKAEHFVSVSSMSYRMKRNGAGLASIAIIVTMVLVMFSATSSLWFGAGDMLNSRYPGDLNFTARFEELSELEEANIADYRNAIDAFNNGKGLDTDPVLDLPYAVLYGLCEGDTVDLEYDVYSNLMSDSIRDVYFISLDTYNRISGSSVSLSEDEAIILTSGCSFTHDTLTLKCGDVSETFQLRKPGHEKFNTDYIQDVSPQIVLIVPDLTAALESFTECSDMLQRSVYKLYWDYSLNAPGYEGDWQTYAAAVRESVENTMGEGYTYLFFEEKQANEEEFLNLIGGFLFIGLMLSVVFTLAAVLIIYYKQISEGYEDCKRFSVMRKVGMTKQEIRKSINSQLLVVFFIPLVFAGVHLAFAFPMIGKILLIFGLYNSGLFMLVTLISFVVFAVIYAVIYKVTSNAYYSIVSE